MNNLWKSAQRGQHTDNHYNLNKVPANQAYRQVKTQFAK